ncbi:hypothetical protein EZI54_22740 [Marinobacter halodurans]|uniref:Uncharacterized protein n=1 Tax=Marinobacter halodurans TaxID=2528979 RepID=A0ABY1ZFF3_9GAMM|nr:hypothetical protein [Marinobacter halodurans]TBW47447.1 hypothetical protein EZI54_22740 [Marinobacter halodurans]
MKQGDLCWILYFETKPTHCLYFGFSFAGPTTYDWWVSPQFMDGTFTKVGAIGKIMESFQSWRDFEETMLRMNADGTPTPGVRDANAQKLFQFIGKHRHDYLMFKKALKGQTAIADRPVQLDPFKACRNCGIA